MGMKRVRFSGFTLVELLVVISIIALLISLLFPALAKSRSLALRVQCGSNMRQIGVAMAEYAEEYGGLYPLSDTGNWPFGNFAAYNFNGTWANYPYWGFGMLYYSSFGVQGNNMLNPQPGVLKPTRQGVSMMFSTQPGAFSQTEFVQPSDYNSNGVLDNWSGILSGYSYWLDRGKDWQLTEDLAGYQAEQQGLSGNAIELSYIYLPAYNDTIHVPAANPRSNPGSILVTDNVLFTDQTGQRGLTGFAASGPGVPDSNHVSGTAGHNLPSGSHELYNDGAVVWVPMSQIKPRIQIQAGLVMGW